MSTSQPAPIFVDEGVANRRVVQMGRSTDAAIASLPPDLAARTYSADPTSPLNAVRASHRAEYLDEIEAALAAR